MDTVIKKTKLKTIKQYLDCNINDLDWHDWGSDGTEFLLGHKGYLVLTDEEADQAVEDYIKDSVWAFNPSFLSSHSGIDEGVFKLLQDKCESANEAVLKLIKDFDEFVEDAVGTDGRGHFLSSYDGEENDHEHDNETYYIYRTN